LQLQFIIAWIEHGNTIGPKIAPEMAEDMMSKIGATEGETQYYPKYNFMKKADDNRAWFSRSERLDHFCLKQYAGDSIGDLRKKLK
jgi:hypothetical protein